MLGVVLVVQIVGGLATLAAALARGEAAPATSTLALAVGAGVVGVAGIFGLYQGLAVGRMGVVAPVTGVLAASIPVVVGMLLQGLPDPLVVGGIALGLLSVVLVSRVRGPAGGRSGIEFALLAGVGIGLFNVLVSRFPAGQVFAPLLVARATSAGVVLGVVAITHRAWRVPRSALPAAVAVGLFDLGGNALFVLATQVGRLDVAAVLSSLYPVVTIVLAIALLHERVTLAHAAGIVAAAAAVALIAAG